MRLAKITDGLSKTACVSECNGRGIDMDGDFNGSWVSGKNISHITKGINTSKTPDAWHKERIYSQHPGGAHFLYCDGAVEFLSSNTKKDVLRAICSRNGEEN
jgi:prepilin-type processing-associated H-X9-DG protein